MEIIGFGVLAVAVNWNFWAVMFFVQEWESNTGRIPARSPHNPKDPVEGFLYMQDFFTIKWGDTIGISAVDFGVIAVLQNVWPLPFAGILACVLVGVVVTSLAHRLWMGQLHKPDAGYPAAGVVSIFGRVHLLYFFVQITIGAIGLWLVGLMILGQFPWSSVAVVGLGGGFFYLLTWLADMKTRRFARLQP